MRRLILMLMAFMVIAGTSALAETGGFQGVVLEKSTFLPIPSVRLRFLSEDGRILRSAVTDSRGYYRILLQPGRYLVTAAHRKYEDYASAPGFFVVTGTAYQIGNIFLSEPRVTMVVLVRHGERANDSLSQAGRTRARLLAALMHRAGVSAIYTTDTNRTRETVRPLAEALKLTPIIYDNEEALVTRILKDHEGDVVLVAGHSNTILTISRQLGANVPAGDIQDFDNLFIVARQAGGERVRVNLMNLQYGEASHPDNPVKFSEMTTVMLIRHAEEGEAGRTRAQTLARVAQHGGVKAIFATPERVTQETVTPLANTMSPPLTINTLTSAQTFVDHELPRYRGQVVLVTAPNPILGEIIRKIGGTPVPPLLPGHYDNLLVLILPKPGGARVVNLRYGVPTN